MLKVGILGTGFGSFHAQLFKKIENAEVSGIFGRDIDKLGKIGTKYNIPVFTDPIELIMNQNTDLIDICLPTAIHTEYILKAFENGKHVLCETPVAYTLEEIRKIKEASVKYNRKFFGGMFINFWNEFTKIGELIKSGEYGKTKSIFISRRTAPVWKYMDPMVHHLMQHDIDFVTGIFDKPENISTSGTAGKKDSEKHIIASMNFGDTTAFIESISMMPEGYPFTVSCRVLFENAAVEYETYATSEIFRNDLIIYDKNGSRKIECPDEDWYTKELTYVVDNIINDREENIISIEKTELSIETALKIKESYERK